MENRVANRVEDINFVRLYFDLSDIFFETKALDFSGAKTKTGWMPPPLCWMCASTVQLLHQGKGNVEFVLSIFCGRHLQRLAIEGIWRVGQ